MVVSSCQTPYSPPKSEACTATQQGDLACFDPRLPEDRQKYFRELEATDQCTNIKDYDALYNYTIELRKKLIKCERSKKKLLKRYKKH